MGVQKRSTAGVPDTSPSAKAEDVVHATKAPVHDPRLPGPFPEENPTFTLADLRRAIPPHCFERSYATSFGHLALDLIKLAAMYGVLYGYEKFAAPALPALAAVLFYPVWWYATGSVMTGLWVLAHECGHQAFSPNEWVNDIVGYILHTALLVPYHAWRVSHGNHHSNTGSMENDEVFVPAERPYIGEHITTSPLFQLLEIANMLLLGWCVARARAPAESRRCGALTRRPFPCPRARPGYLIFNLSGPRKYQNKKNSHFEPDSALFRRRDYWGIVVSTAGVLAVLFALAVWTVNTSVWTVFRLYTVPYLITNLHLVLITYLQHTDVYLPHFRGKVRPGSAARRLRAQPPHLARPLHPGQDWNWVRGAMCTVDRSYGWILDHTFHRIADKHVCHHLFSYMPFYHHAEATEAMRPILGKYFMEDPTPVPLALWRAWTNCKFVEPEGGMVYYKKSLKE